MSLNDRVESLSKVMKNRDIDAMIASQNSNVFYATNYISHLRSRSTIFTVVPADEEPSLVVPAGLLDLCIERPDFVKDVRAYGKFFFTPHTPDRERLLTEPERKLETFAEGAHEDSSALDLVAQILSEKGLTRKRIGIDESSTDEIEGARKLFGSTELTHAPEVFQEARRRKGYGEVKLLEKSAKIAEGGMKAAFEGVHEGISELEIYRKFAVSVVQAGGVPFASLGCGSRSAFPNAVPTDYRLRKGDIIRFDGGCVYNGYNSDISATAVLGQPNDKIATYYDALLKGAKDAVRKIRPGTKLNEIFDAAVSSVRENGIPHYSRNHCGHCIGIDVYESPIITATNAAPVEEDMVLCVETPYYEIGFGGLQVEFMISVNHDGPRYLSTFGEQLPFV